MSSISPDVFCPARDTSLKPPPPIVPSLDRNYTKRCYFGVELDAAVAIYSKHQYLDCMVAQLTCLHQGHEEGCKKRNSS